MKVYVDSIGCRLNQSEIEKIAAQFSARGHELTEAIQQADIVVINTCAVTGKAVADSRRAVRQAASNPGVRIVTTGCWASLEPENILRLADNIQIVSNQDKAMLPSQLTGEVEENLSMDTRPNPGARAPLPGARFRTRAFIKVQDGCDQHCTFCITRVARGSALSVPAGEVLQDIQWALDGGAQEAVLTGVNLGAWGKDISPPLGLHHLIDTLLQKTNLPRLRLSSLEPWDLDAQFFARWQNTRLCPQLHLPLQSGSNPILKKMGRQTSRESFRELVWLARQIVPDMAISTDMIVGFPGETEVQFEESMAFVREMHFSAGHVFAFSPRPGTPAARLPDRVPGAVIKRRSWQMRALFEECGRAYRETLSGKTVEVLWETATQRPEGDWVLSGLSGHSIRVEAVAPLDRWNRIDCVKLTAFGETRTLGEIVTD